MNMNSQSGEGYVKMFDWNSNPFTFRIMPELFTGYQDEIDSLVNSVGNGTKFSLLTGPTGSGKTTMMRHLIKKINSDHIIYLPKPPKDPKDFVDIFQNELKRSFTERLLMRSRPNLYNITGYVNKKLGGKRLTLLIDESHEASLESLEWLRTLVDQIDNLYIMFAGLPIFEKMLKEKLETLKRRISLQVGLGNLTKSETKDLIKRRIESAGGSDVKPFTYNSIEMIYEKTGGFPREVIRLCDDVVKNAVKKNISLIDSEFLAEEEAEFQRASVDILEGLPEKQKTILDTLSKFNGLSPSEVLNKSEKLKGYKNKGNAVRSINNLLKRLMKDKLIIRKKKGKTYKYEISPKMKSLFVNA